MKLVSSPVEQGPIHQFSEFFPFKACVQKHGLFGKRTYLRPTKTTPFLVLFSLVWHLVMPVWYFESISSLWRFDGLIAFGLLVERGAGIGEVIRM